MKCRQCEKEGLESNLYPGMSTSTAMYCSPYYDENGLYHFHDMNTHRTNYTCSNGHSFGIKSENKCPSCGWTNAVHTVKE